MAKNMIRSDDWLRLDPFGRLGNQVPLKQLDEKLDLGLGQGDQYKLRFNSLNRLISQSGFDSSNNKNQQNYQHKRDKQTCR